MRSVKRISRHMSVKRLVFHAKLLWNAHFNRLRTTNYSNVPTRPSVIFISMLHRLWRHALVLRQVLQFGNPRTHTVIMLYFMLYFHRNISFLCISLFTRIFYTFFQSEYILLNFLYCIILSQCCNGIVCMLYYILFEYRPHCILLFILNQY